VSSYGLKKIFYFDDAIGIIDLKFTMNDGETVQGGTKECVKEIDHKDLRRIVVTFFADEDYISFIKFVYKNGSISQIGLESTYKLGRVETFELHEGEQLLGCEMDHSSSSVYGLTWVVWRPPKV
jgi:ribosomal protein L7Ae-like RNA K-turn-binding protein